MSPQHRLSPAQARLAVAELVAGLTLLPQLPRVVTAPYDSYTHLFFASHYLLGWFAPLDFRWYTGFPITSYPPLVHQLLAVIAWPLVQLGVPMLDALELAYAVLAATLTLAFPLAMYLFARTLVKPRAAATAGLVGTFFTGWWMLLLGYGQLPTLTGIVLSLLGAAALDRYLRAPGWLTGGLAVTLTAAVPMAHHFSVLSLLPAVYSVVIYKHARESGLRPVLRQALPVGAVAIALAIAAVFPFLEFLITAPDQPIIPHASRQSWLEGNVLDRPQLGLALLSGLFMLLVTPVVAWRTRDRPMLEASVGFAVVFALLSMGFTTPLPRILYGPLAETLTYFRFAAWGGILLLPALGVAVERVIDDYDDLEALVFRRDWRTVATIVVFALVICLQVVTATQITGHGAASPDRTQQVNEIATVMTTDNHDRWRYLALGMSQELGALAIQAPTAQTIDGNYNTGRAKSDLTYLKQSGAEPLAAAKYMPEGQRALDHYLERRDEFGIKYVFSADPAYEETLRQHGYEVLYGDEWDWLGVTAWYDPDVPPAHEEAPEHVGGESWKMYPWGILPLATLATAGVIAFASHNSSVR